MRISKSETCATCPIKCDIYLTALEMNIEHELEPLQVYYKKHEIICRQRTPVNHATILVAGNAKMYIDGLISRNIILNILLPSNYIGLMSVFGSPEYLYNVSSLDNCHTCQVDISLIRKMYYNNAHFLQSLNEAFGASVASIMNKLISLSQKQVRGKVAESLLYLAKLYDSKTFTLTITRKELGELSAISEENAVRVLTEYRNEGIIDMCGRKMVLKDIETLQRISLSC